MVEPTVIFSCGSRAVPPICCRPRAPQLSGRRRVCAVITLHNTQSRKEKNQHTKYHFASHNHSSARSSFFFVAGASWVIWSSYSKSESTRVDLEIKNVTEFSVSEAKSNRRSIVYLVRFEARQMFCKARYWYCSILGQQSPRRGPSAITQSAPAKKIVPAKSVLEGWHLIRVQKRIRCSSQKQSKWTGMMLEGI